MTSKPKQAKTCLVVEDNPTDVKLLERTLKRAGYNYNFVVADTKKTFLNKLDQIPEPDLIISDFNLPSFTGAQVFKEIRERGIISPFILLTGALSEDVASEMLQLGIDDYVLKDRISRLPVAVETVIEKATLRQDQKKALKKLVESERKYASLSSISPAGIFRVDDTGRCLYVNRKYCELTGLREEEAKGFGYLKSVHPDDVKAVNVAWKVILDTNQPTSTEFRFVKPDGDVVWVIGQTTTEIDAEGNITGAVGTITDITEHKERDLERQRLSNVVKQINNSAIITDAEGRIQWVNDGFTKLSGFRLEEIYGQKPGAILQGPLTTDESRKAIRRGLDSKEPFTVEIINYHRNGTPYDISLSITPILNEKEEVVQFVGISTDITDRKAKEREVIEAEKRLRGVLQQSPDAVLLTDSSGEIIFFNQKAEELFGYAAEEMLGETVEKLVPTKFRKGHPKKRAAYAERATQRKMALHGMHFHGMRKDGTQFPADIMLSPIQQGDEQHIMAIVRDITEQKKIAEERRQFTEQLEAKVEARTLELSKTNEQLSELNRNLTDSINYAERLQLSILPEIDELNRAFSDSFVLFKPKDVVSGDFYWFHEQKNGAVLVCADCTGHGVPGAFMSMLGVELLNKYVAERGVKYPTYILENMDDGLEATLGKTGETTVADGMDISICTVDRVRKRIHFAGAARPLIHISKGELNVYKGSRFGLGALDTGYAKDFDTHIINYQEGDMIYQFSDGYADQFGGEKGRKFMMKSLKNLLLEIHSLPCSDQHTQLLKTFNTWKGSYEQVDDVLVMGVRL